MFQFSSLQELEQQLQTLALALDEAEISKETQDTMGDPVFFFLGGFQKIMGLPLKK